MILRHLLLSRYAPVRAEDNIVRTLLEAAKGAIAEAEGMLDAVETKKVTLQAATPAVVGQHQRAFELLLEHLDEIEKRLRQLEGRQ